jgi:hypothetical protein
MSRASVKEPDGDQVVEDAPERVQSPHAHCVTRDGLRQLHERLSEFLELRNTVVGSASAHDQRRLRYIDRDLGDNEQRIRRAVPVDPAGREMKCISGQSSRWRPPKASG